MLALPAWVVMTAGLLWCAYVGYNLAKSPAFDDSAVWTDVHAKRVLDPANAAPPLLNPHASAMGSPMTSTEIPELTDLPLNWVNRVMFSDQQAALGSPGETAWSAGEVGSTGLARGSAGSHTMPSLAVAGRPPPVQTLLQARPGDPLRDAGSSSALPSGLVPLTLRLPHSLGHHVDSREWPAAAAQPAVQQLDDADDTEPLTPMVDADQLMANLLRGLTSTATPQPVPSAHESGASRSEESGQSAGLPHSAGQAVGLLDMPRGAVAALSAGRPRGPTEMSAFSFGLLSDDGDDDSAGS